MGVITKKNKPARSQAYGLTWFSEPQSPPNILSAEADWKDIPILYSSDNSSGKIAIPFHDESNYDIARLLLKIGIEIYLPIKFAEGEDIKQILKEAKAHIIDINAEPWPYFVLRSDAAEKYLVSFLALCPTEHDYIKSCGFDAFFHEINSEIVLFFTYGHFRAAISLTSRKTNWTEIFTKWNVPHVGCPSMFQHINA